MFIFVVIGLTALILYNFKAAFIGEERFLGGGGGGVTYQLLTFRGGGVNSFVGERLS